MQISKDYLLWQKKYNLKLVLDNTFSPVSISLAKLGTEIVCHSLTKFINGSSDTVGGVVCGAQEFINNLRNINNGASILLAVTLNYLRASSI